jgi:tripeptide aminopeptidase
MVEDRSFVLNENEKRDLLERFVRYCKINTRSSETTQTFPSTKEQWDLLNLLKKELEEMGLDEISLDKNGYLFATIPSSKGAENAPVLGYFAHVDTYPGTSGENVNPQIIENYDGKPIHLPYNGITITEDDSPYLKQFVGHTVVTTDGSTLLGADDKAGVAAIMEMAKFFMNNKEIPHPKIRICFSPDEETGRGMDFFDTAKFGADIAYTVDGSILGEIETETFCGDSATVTITGYDIHPGLAKGKMKNAVRAAADFIKNLPENFLPETTENKEPYIHPIALSGEVGQVVVKFILRAFSDQELEDRTKDLIRVAKETEKRWEGVSFEVKVEKGYKNMKVVLDKYPKVVAIAKQAIKMCGVEPYEGYIRGGTDGCRLCFMGLPTPNLFNGALCFHGVKEHISLEWLAKSCETIRNLAFLWAKEASLV